jgi:selenide,water dikinase
LKHGDVLILTRPIGTGILFAAAMRGLAAAALVADALAEMRRSNRKAAEIMLNHGATAMTDVSGFGLIGHLGEMLTASGAEAELDLASIPGYPGAIAHARTGVASTLLPENLARLPLLRGNTDAATTAVLFDPQTSGGLLAGVPARDAAACVASLRSAGHAHAAAIGQVKQAGAGAAAISVDGNLA